MTTPVPTDFTSDSLKLSMQQELLSNFRTGNIIYDTMVSMVLFTIVGGMLNKMGDFTNAIISYCKWFYRKIKLFAFNKYEYIIYNLLNYEKVEEFDKTVHIEYITDNKEVNELYKAVYWYLSTTQLIDYKMESPVKYTFEEPINVVKDYNINQVAMYDTEKSFTYGTHKICYTLSKHLINVYAEQERKRENYSIRIWTTYNKKENDDVLKKFCEFCTNEYAKSLCNKKWEQKIFINENGKWNENKSDNKRSLENIILRDNMTAIIKNDVKTFLDSEDWYINRDIPYTRGYLFYGLPGCGKTSMIKGISNFCQRHIHYLILNSVKTDIELLKLLADINYSKTILVIEDIDCMTDIIKNRDNKNVVLDDIKKEIDAIKESMKENNKNNERRSESTGELTLSGVLNAIDGVFNNHGRILIMTTNHPEVLDQALIRPGRIDKKIMFKNCDKKQVADIYKMFFDADADEKHLELVEDDKFSPAFITKLLLHYKDTPLESLTKINEFKCDVDIKPLFSKPLVETQQNDSGYESD